MNRNGTLLWEKTLGSANQEWGLGLCTRDEGGYIAIGTTYVGPIGGEDCWIFVLDDAGNEIANKKFGGTQNDDPVSILPYLNGYVAAGTSGSAIFTEGSCNLNNSGAFVSYIGVSSLEIADRHNEPGILRIFPNPASGVVTFTYSVEAVITDVTIMVTNVLGEKVCELHTGNSRGTVYWDGYKQSPGVYIYQASDVRGIVSMGKIVVVR